MKKNVKSLWHESPSHSVLREVPLPKLEKGELLLRTYYALISQGTERLVATGGVPPDLYEAMRVPYMEGDFSLPVKYGYSLVGEIVSGGHPLRGKMVHLMHPHQESCVISEKDCFVIPDGVPARRAVLAPNMETAITALWDARVLVGERVLLVGFGLVGSLVARLLSQLPGVDLQIAEPQAYRSDLAKKMGFSIWDGSGDFDLAFHTSGTEQGLHLCLDVLSVEGRVVELSWYGSRRPALPLGHAFHSKRLRLISSQVGHLPGAQLPRWDYARRKDLVFRLLADAAYDEHLDAKIPFEGLPDFFRKLRSGDEINALGVVVEMGRTTNFS